MARPFPAPICPSSPHRPLRADTARRAAQSLRLRGRPTGSDRRTAGPRPGYRAAAVVRYGRNRRNLPNGAHARVTAAGAASEENSKAQRKAHHRLSPISDRRGKARRVRSDCGR
eukprot:755463-Hanusia_phi.AAC.4